MTVRIIVMGPSGCGKSTVGLALAESIGARFIDADDLHPITNVDKMAAGIPLDDDDRMPWLGVVGRALQADDRIVIACSALRRIYRDAIRAESSDAFFAELTVDRAALEERMRARTDHFMPAALHAVVAGQVFHQQGPGAHQAQLAFQHVPQFRQLVQAGRAQPAAKRGKALRIVQRLSVGIGGIQHAAEFQHQERLFVQAGTLLFKENRAAHLQGDQYGHACQHGRKQQQGGGRGDDVEQSFDHDAMPISCSMVALTLCTL